MLADPVDIDLDRHLRREEIAEQQAQAQSDAALAMLTKELQAATPETWDQAQFIGRIYTSLDELLNDALYHRQNVPVVEAFKRLITSPAAKELHGELAIFLSSDFAEDFASLT